LLSRCDFKGIGERVNRCLERPDATRKLAEIKALNVATPGVNVGLQTHEVVPAPPRVGECVQE
jgi:hypothetical protein